ncbi:MAG: ABC transporter substrate-binding protein [Cyanobacteria bacterium SBLK]|nr:ABC transporter substrate-binding protein [Cyanobacteria bacterium SBLK]
MKPIGKRSKYRGEILFLLSLLTFILVLGWANLNFNRETITIAIAAPQSNTEEANLFLGREMIDGAQFYIDRANKAGGINGKKLKLVVYDDQFNPDRAEEVAKEICDSSALGILGHYGGRLSLRAGEVYKTCQIPALTGSATADSVTVDNPWYFRAIFTNRAQSQFMAEYIQYILQAKNVYLISGDNTYGETFSRDLKESFAAFGKDFLGMQKIESDELERSSDRIVIDLLKLQQSERKPDLIVLVAQNFEAEKIVLKMRRNGIDFPIFGGDAMADISFAESFLNTPEEQNQRGFFSNGIHAIAPAILDISDERGQIFKNEFEARYGYTPGWVSTFYYDGANLLVAAIQNSLTEGASQPDTESENIPIMRDRVRDSLTKIDSLRTSVEGLTRNLYFNSERTIVSQILMGVFRQNDFVSAFTQLTPIENLKSISRLAEKIKNNQIIQLGDGSYVERTSIVDTGIDINEVTKIDERTSSYLIDFYLWFRYQGDFKPDNIEFTNFSVERLDSGEKLTLDEPIQQDIENDVNYVVYRVKADFYEEFDFHKYPFDRQILSIRFRHNLLTRDRLIYVVDFVGMRHANVEEILQKFKTDNVFGKITNWRVTNALFFQNSHISRSTLGVRRLIESNAKFNYSKFNAEIEIKRDLLRFSIKNLLPLWFFVGVAYSLLFLPPEDISVEAIGSLLLAIVFYHLSLLDSLPEGIGYVVALDYAFYIIYSLLALELLLVILGYSPILEARGITRKKLIIFGRISFPLLWTMGCGSLYFIYA